VSTRPLDLGFTAAAAAIATGSVAVVTPLVTSLQPVTTTSGRTYIRRDERAPTAGIATF